jgi:hypothetical protein
MEQLALFECLDCHSMFLFAIDKEQHTCDTGHREFDEIDMDDYALR